VSGEPVRPRVYVAGSAATPESTALAREVIALCRMAGWPVTFDWTEDEARKRATTERGALGLDELRAVERADLVIVLPGRLGTAFEMGVAIAHRKPVYLFHLEDMTPTADAWDALPFAHLPYVHRFPLRRGPGFDPVSIIEAVDAEHRKRLAEAAERGRHFVGAVTPVRVEVLMDGSFDVTWREVAGEKIQNRNG
jgi:hypothetical protein